MRLSPTALFCGAAFTVFLASTGVSAGRVSCYLLNWSLYRPDVGHFTIDDVPGDLCTHVMYSFAAIDTNAWQLKMTDAGIDVAGYSALTGLKQRYPQLKTLLAVGGGSERGFSPMVAEKSHRDSLIRSIIDNLHTYGFDGVDIDWEYPGAADRGGNPSDKGNFVTFLQELRTAFSNEGRGWEITMAVPLVQSDVNNGYNVPALCGLVDAVNAMAYDMRGSWTGYADVQSPMYSRPLDQGSYKLLNVKDGLEFWVNSGCPREKLILGIPTYGRTYNLAGSNHQPGASITGEGNPGPYTKSTGTLAYYEICLNKWTREWEPTAECPYAYSGNQWVGYDDPQSVEIKANFAKQNGYGGVMTWTVDMDDFKGACGTRYPLISVMSNVMRSSGQQTQRPQTTAKPTTAKPTTSKPTTISSGTPKCSSGDDYLPDKNCVTYYRCVNGVIYAYTCQGGTVWNQNLKVCDWPSNSPRAECR